MPDVSGGPLMLLTGLEQELARKMCAFHIAVFFFLECGLIWNSYLVILVIQR